MKRFISFYFCIISIAVASGQIFSFEKTNQRVAIDVQAGINVSGYSVNFMSGTLAGVGFDTGAGFNVGFSFDIPLTKSFYLQSGIYWSSQFAMLQTFDENHVQSLTFHPSYLKFPILTSLRFNFSDQTLLQFNIGPYPAIGTRGKVQGEYEIFNQTYIYDNNIFNPLVIDGYKKGWSPYCPSILKRFDIGLSLGLGFNYQHFIVGMKYDLGLANLANYDKLRLPWQPNDGSVPGISNNLTDIVHYGDDVYQMVPLASKYGIKGIHSRCFSINVGYKFTLPQIRRHTKGVRSIRDTQEQQ